MLMNRDPMQMMSRPNGACAGRAPPSAHAQNNSRRKSLLSWAGPVYKCVTTCAQRVQSDSIYSVGGVREILLFSFAMPGPRKERRKKNFSQDERAIVVSAMERYDSRLHGADSGSTSKTKKEEILRKVTAQVNALGHEARTPQEIQKKMNDLRGVVRNKMAIIAKHARGTGGGPPCSTRLTEEEEVIARCLRREQVEGLEGHDSSEPPMRTGKCVLSSGVLHVWWGWWVM